MKKSSHTMERNIGIYVFGLLVFLVISCSQDVLALTTQDLLEDPSFATTTQTKNGVTLSVMGASAATTNKGLFNKLFYNSTNATAAGAGANVPLVWTEKIVLNGSANTANPEAKITATTQVAGNLIVKIDMFTATTGAAITDHTTSGAINMSMKSYWLKSETGAGPFSSTAIVMAEHGETVDGVVINRSTLSSLVLTNVTATTATTFTLFDFFTKSRMATHVIITAVLVDDSGSVSPKVLGVDIQTLYFNTEIITGGVPARPIWLDLVTATGSYNGS
jgi:hypothetical protein